MWSRHRRWQRHRSLLLLLLLLRCRVPAKPKWLVAVVALLACLPHPSSSHLAAPLAFSINNLTPDSTLLKELGFPIIFTSNSKLQVLCAQLCSTRF
jgi:hypothetical protein